MPVGLQNHNSFCRELIAAITQFRLIPVLGEDIFRFKHGAPEYKYDDAAPPVTLSGKTLDEVMGEIFDIPATGTLAPPNSPTWIERDFLTAAINPNIPASARPFEACCRRVASDRNSSSFASFVQTVNQVVGDLYVHLDLSLLQRVFGWEMPLILSMTIDGVTERYRERYRSEYESISLIDGHDNGSGDTVTDAVLHCFGSCYPERGSNDYVAISASSIAKAISQLCLINADGPIKQGNRPALSNFLRGSNRKDPVYLFLGTNFSAYPAYFLKSFLENSKSNYRIFLASRHSLSDSNVLSLLDQLAPGKIRLLSLPPSSLAPGSSYLGDFFDWLEAQVKPRVQATIPVVFISYARTTETGVAADESIGKARALKLALEAGGKVIAILDAQTFNTGEELPAEVRHNIYRADLVVIVGTSSYLARIKSYGQSMNWLQRELALAKRKPVYAVKNMTTQEEEKVGGIYAIWAEDNGFDGFKDRMEEEMKLHNPLLKKLIFPMAPPTPLPGAGSPQEAPVSFSSDSLLVIQNIIETALKRYMASH